MWAGIAVVLLLIVAILVAFGRQLVGITPGSPEFGVNAIGEARAWVPRPVPDAQLNVYNGPPLKLSDLRGQVVVLNFWGSTCVPCQDEAPVLQQVAQAMKGQGVNIVGSTSGMTPRLVRRSSRNSVSRIPTPQIQTASSQSSWGSRGSPKRTWLTSKA